MGSAFGHSNPVDTALCEVLPDALVTVDQAGRIVDVNRAGLEMFGYEKDELLGQLVEKLMPERLRAGHTGHRLAYQRDPSVRQMKAGLDLMACRKDGAEFPVDIMLSPISNPVKGTIAVIRDISMLEEISKELERLAYLDKLTGLRNRTALYHDLPDLLHISDHRQASHFAIALFDLDKFKDVNDTLGHSAGDELLKLVAQRCVGIIRNDVRFYRLGGDEFVALMPLCSDVECAELIVSQILNALSLPFTTEGQALFINSSAGVALAPQDGAVADDLLANADLALYKAKARGGACHVLFHDSFRAEAIARNSLNIRLRQALEDGDFELFYQPTVSLADRAIVGAEALLRWRDNGRIIAPSAFIELLGNGQLSERVGDWILAQACGMASSIRSDGFEAFRIAVNLFPSQLADPDFPQQVQTILADCCLDASALQLEITETIALKESDAFIGALSQLRTMGVDLAFDDFGTGFASLSFLTSMPLTHIKLDRSFIVDLPNNPNHSAIVRALLQMSADLGLQVIAEGVEHGDQESFLRRFGCDEAQGFLYGRPMPFDDFRRLLVRRNDVLGEAKQAKRLNLRTA